MKIQPTSVIADDQDQVQVARAFDTQRLHLRPLGESDEALYCHLYTDPEMMRHIGAPLSAEAALRSFEKACALATQPAPALQLWVITEHGSPERLGLLARVRHDDVTDMMELGTMLVAEGQGRGFAAEALAALMDRLFTLPEIRMLWTAQAADNAAAARLMHRLGFERALAPELAAADWRWQLDRAKWLAQQQSVAAP